MITHDNPFIQYALFEDKSQYLSATDFGLTDLDDDFLIGNSGGILMNFRFKFIDTHIFSEAALTYERNYRDQEIRSWVENYELEPGECRDKLYYCPFPTDSVEYQDFWYQEKKRRREGMIAPCGVDANGNRISIKITGAHYNYLNYGRIERYPNAEEADQQRKQGYSIVRTVEGFPRFWDADYWVYKVKQLAELNRKNECIGKARRKGYSYKKGADAGSELNITPNISILFAAHDIGFLTDKGATTYMTKTCLDWYETHTHWQRGYISEDLENIELGYKLTDTGHKTYGYKSRLISVSTATNTSAAIGKKAIKIVFEEAGKYPELADVIDVTLSNAESGAIKIGNMTIFGTGGTKNANWAAFKSIFYNVKGYDILGFENVWDKGARHSVCGFFHPNIWALEDEEGTFLDEHGNSNLLEAWTFDQEQKAIKRSTLTDMSKYTTYIGQRANSPSEAFASGQENLFTSPELDMHIINVVGNREYKYYRDGMLVNTGDGLVFKTNKQLEELGIKTHPYLEDNIFKQGQDLMGCIREYYPPVKVMGRVPDNLYTAVLDPVAKDKKSAEVTAKHSLNSMYVMMNPNNAEYTTSIGDIIVAAYCGRTELTVDNSRLFFNLCEYYGCKGLAEVDTGTTVHDAKTLKKLHLLATNPMVALQDKIHKQLSKDYGIVIGGTTKAQDGLLYLKDWLYTPVAVDEDGNTKYVLHYVTDIPLLLELQSFSLTGNFDRISAMRVYMFARKAYTLLKKKVETVKEVSIFQQIGLHSKYLNKIRR